MRVIAIDPGGGGTYGGTGWVQMIDGVFTEEGTLRGEDYHLRLERLLFKRQYDYVVYERFDHRNAEFAKLQALEYIGVIKLYCQRYDIKHHPQGSDVKRWSSDAKLTLLGIDMTGSKDKKKREHVISAYRHMVYWFCFGTHPYNQLRDETFERLKALK